MNMIFLYFVNSLLWRALKLCTMEFSSDDYHSFCFFSFKNKKINANSFVWKRSSCNSSVMLRPSSTTNVWVYMNAMNPTRRVPIHILPNMFMLGKKTPDVAYQDVLNEFDSMFERGGGGFKSLITNCSNLVVTWEVRPQTCIISWFPLNFALVLPGWLYLVPFLAIDFSICAPPPNKKNQHNCSMGFTIFSRMFLCSCWMWRIFCNILSIPWNNVYEKPKNKTKHIFMQRYRARLLAWQSTEP